MKPTATVDDIKNETKEVEEMSKLSEEPIVSFITAEKVSTAVDMVPIVAEQNPAARKVPAWSGHYLWSLLTTLFCFGPLSIIGLIQFLSARTEYSRGNMREALKKKRQAKYWSTIAFVVGFIAIAAVITYLLLQKREDLMQERGRQLMSQHVSANLPSSSGVKLELIETDPKPKATTESLPELKTTRKLEFPRRRLPSDQHSAHNGPRPTLLHYFLINIIPRQDTATQSSTTNIPFTTGFSNWNFGRQRFHPKTTGFPLNTGFNWQYFARNSGPTMTPDFTTPDFTTPDFTTPDFTTPDFTAPDFTTPDITTPDITTPDFTTPDFTTPDITTPDITTADLKTPIFDTSTMPMTTGFTTRTGQFSSTFFSSPTTQPSTPTTTSPSTEGFDYIFTSDIPSSTVSDEGIDLSNDFITDIPEMTTVSDEGIDLSNDFISDIPEMTTPELADHEFEEEIKETKPLTEEQLEMEAPGILDNEPTTEQQFEMSDRPSTVTPETITETSQGEETSSTSSTSSSSSSSTSSTTTFPTTNSSSTSFSSSSSTTTAFPTTNVTSDFDLDNFNNTENATDVLENVDFTSSSSSSTTTSAILTTSEFEPLSDVGNATNKADGPTELALNDSTSFSTTSSTTSTTPSTTTTTKSNTTAKKNEEASTGKTSKI